MQIRSEDVGAIKVKLFDFTPPQWCAVACGAMLAAAQQMPYADAVLIGLMAIELAVGALYHAREGTFHLKEFKQALFGKIIIGLVLLAVHAIEPLIPPDKLSVEFDKWFATALCGYEMVAIFRTYTKATGRQTELVDMISRRLGGQSPKTIIDSTGRHIIPEQRPPG